MKGRPIRLFMWAYQPHFRAHFQICMNNVMNELGVSQAGAECLLVGARAPGKQKPNAVCVEPEDGKWHVSLFDGLLDQIEIEVKEHPLQRMSYTDEPTMRDKPENIRRDSVRKAVQRALEPYDVDSSSVHLLEDRHRNQWSRAAMAAIEAAVVEVPTRHRLLLGDARLAALSPGSVHLVVTSPPYWILKEYRRSDGQLGWVEDYAEFLAQLDQVWRMCHAALETGGLLSTAQCRPAR